jgi:uncharacterized protein
MAPQDTPRDPAMPGNEMAPPAPVPSLGSKIFLGPNGLRAGWRMLIFVGLFAVLLLLMQAGLKHIRPLETWRHAQPKGMFTPGIMLLAEGIAALSLALAALVMTFIEKKSFADYGLPGKEAFGKRFWQGVPYGFVMMTLLMVLIAAFHGYSFGGVALGRAEAVHYGVLYFIGFILVGFFEEFSFRGYLQATLASGIGFWPAAILLSIAFGAVHLGNTGEAALGALSAGGFGLVAAFSVQRTGNIWFAIGEHAAWDWGETYFYGVADSGQLAQGHLLNSSFHGPAWLTGGSVGPEGSLFVFVVLILWAVGVYFLFPAKRKTI